MKLTGRPEEYDAEMARWPGGWTDGTGVSYQDYEANADHDREAGTVTDLPLEELITRSAEPDPDPEVETARQRYLDAEADRDDARIGAVWVTEQAAAAAWSEYEDTVNARREAAPQEHDWEAGA